MAADYDVFVANGHQILNVPYDYEKVYPGESLWNANYVHGFFVDYWHYSIAIALFYCITIHGLAGWMKERKPWQLKWSLTAWNGMLALFSIVATYRFGIEFAHTLTTRPLYDSICYSVNPRGPAAFWACAFAFSKVAELGDTIFIVLRKRPLIFLHWYHHAVVLVYVWHSTIELTAAGRWFIFMNYAVHSIMYTYYTLASMRIRLPKIVSMTVTTLQTTQMLFGVGISATVLYIKSHGGVCQQSMDNLALCFAIYASFAVLFMNFFRKAYLVTGGKREGEKKTQ